MAIAGRTRFGTSVGGLKAAQLTNLSMTYSKLHEGVVEKDCCRAWEASSSMLAWRRNENLM